MTGALRHIRTRTGRNDCDVEILADVFGHPGFKIYAQAGSVSGWHCDNMGARTAVTLESNSKSPEDQSDALKAWAIINFDSLSDSEKDAALDEFASEGPEWVPDINLVRVIHLVPGDTLIMAPGTIHAPVSITNAFFHGSFYWSRHSFITAQLPKWLWIAEHPNTTNEDAVKGTRLLLAWVQDDMRANPTAYGIAPETDMALVDASIARIGDLSLQCSGSHSKKGSCDCENARIPCGSLCRP